MRRRVKTQFACLLFAVLLFVLWMMAGKRMEPVLRGLGPRFTEAGF